MKNILTVLFFAIIFSTSVFAGYPCGKLKDLKLKATNWVEALNMDLSGNIQKKVKSIPVLMCGKPEGGESYSLVGNYTPTQVAYFSERTVWPGEVIPPLEKIRFMFFKNNPFAYDNFKTEIHSMLVDGKILKSETLTSDGQAELTLTLVSFCGTGLGYDEKGDIIPSKEIKDRFLLIKSNQSGFLYCRSAEHYRSL